MAAIWRVDEGGSPQQLNKHLKWMASFNRESKQKTGIIRYILLLSVSWVFWYAVVLHGVLCTALMVLCADAEVQLDREGDKVPTNFTSGASLVHDGSQSFANYATASKAFFWVFIVELTVRILGSPASLRQLYEDTAMKFDIFVCITWAIDDYILIPRVSRDNPVGILLRSIARTLRLMRAVRNLRVVKFWEPVHRMVVSLIASLEPFAVAISLVSAGCLAYAVAMSYTVGQDSASHKTTFIKDNYKTVASSFFAGYELLLRGTGNDFFPEFKRWPWLALILQACFVMLNNFCLICIVSSIFIEVAYMTRKKVRNASLKSNAWMGSAANQKLLTIFTGTSDGAGLLTWVGVQRAIAANPEICGETGCNMRTARTVFDQMKSKNRDTVAVHDFTQALINAMCMGGKNIDNVVMDFEQFRINRELTIMGETSTCQIRMSIWLLNASSTSWGPYKMRLEIQNE